ncbi:MAG: hypothetical protein LBS63_02015 [Prevotellaceae bacterium]|jgi:hypothetical protein|nr:hypothetical protein [Prevotellaceae bacterium]
MEMGTQNSAALATPDSIWAILKETAQLQKEYELQHAKEIAEREAERAKVAAERKRYTAERERYAAERAKAQAESEKRGTAIDARLDKVARDIENLNKNLGGLSGRIGEIMETLLAARLWEKFGAYPYGFKRAYQRVGIYDGDNKLTDVDILLSNGEYAMAVEVKNTLNRFIEVDRHVERMEKLLKYPPAEVKGKTVLGAMACGVLDPDVRDYAFSKGFFVLELTGDTVSLASPPSGFVPREWTPPKLGGMS